MSASDNCMCDDLQLPRAVVFDWDNTLTDTRTTIATALNDTRKAFGLQEWTIEEIRQNSARSSRETFPEWFGANCDKARAYFYKRIDETHLVSIKEMPGADILVRSIHKMGIPMFVVSNKRGDLLRDEAKAMKWFDMFAGIAGSTDAVKDKPAREIVDLAMQEAGLTPDASVWFIGDAEIDVQTAYNSGCTPVLIGDIVLAKRLGVDLVFSDCQHLCDLLYNDSNNETRVKGRLQKCTPSF